MRELEQLGDDYKRTLLDMEREAYFNRDIQQRKLEVDAENLRLKGERVRLAPSSAVFVERPQCVGSCYAEVLSNLGSQPFHPGSFGW